MEPEVFDHVARRRVASTGPATSSRSCSRRACRSTATSPRATGRTSAPTSPTCKAQADVLTGKVDVDIDGFEVSPGVWVAEGAEVHPDAVLRGPLYIGDYAKVEAGAELREFTVLGSNVVVKTGAFLHRAVVHDNVFIGPQTNLRACVIGKNTDVMRAARIEEGAVIGDECVIEEEAIVSAGVKIYPFKTVEAGAVVNANVILESRGQRTPVRPARRLRHRQRRDHPRARRPARRRVRHDAAQGLDRHHVARRLPGRPCAQARGHRRAHRPAPSTCSTSRSCRCRSRGWRPPGAAPAASMIAHDARAARERRHRVPRRAREPTSPRPASASWSGRCSREEFRRAFPGEIGDLVVPAARHRELRARAAAPGRHLRRRRGRPEGRRRHRRRHRGARAADAARPARRRRADGQQRPRRGVARPRRRPSDARRCTGSAGWSRRPAPPSACTSTRSASGSRSSTSAGNIIDDERALLVMLDLVAAERRKRHGWRCRSRRPGSPSRWPRSTASTSTGSRRRPPTLTAAARQSDVIFGGDGRGGFVVPEFSTALDGIAAFVQLVGLVARTQLQLSEIDARIPQSHIVRRVDADPVGGQGHGHARGRRGGRRPAASTRPTACGSSRRTAAGRSCCPTRPSRSPTCGPRRAPTSRPASCSTAGSGAVPRAG